MKVATYLRVASDSSPNESIGVQRDRALTFLRDQRLGEIREFADSGGVRWGRPGLENLMAMVEKREVELVVCDRLDRLPRSLGHLADIVDALDAARVGLVCVEQGINTMGRRGEDQMRVLRAVSAFSHQLVRERTMQGMNIARSSGKHVGRPSQKVPPDAERIIREWLAEGGVDYASLGKRLGGIGKAAAWRRVRKVLGFGKT